MLLVSTTTTRKQPIAGGSTVTRLECVIGDLRKEIMAAAGAKVTVKIDIEADLPLVTAESTQLELALLSLTVRARNMMQNGGTLAITASRTRQPRVVRGDDTEAVVRLSVCDTGDAADAPSITQSRNRFRDRNVAREIKHERLQLVQRLVSGFGGSMTFASATDVGTRVDVWLPAVC
jgi:K+-sensing histidine kinase KdpD